jgi:hypothetical protein
MSQLQNVPSYLIEWMQIPWIMRPYLSVILMEYITGSCEEETVRCQQKKILPTGQKCALTTGGFFTYKPRFTIALTKWNTPYLKDSSSPQIFRNHKINMQ